MSLIYIYSNYIAILMTNINVVHTISLIVFKMTPKLSFNLLLTVSLEYGQCKPTINKKVV